MEIAPQALTACDVAPDGSTVLLGFANSDGTPAQIRLSLNQANKLVMTLPDLITRAPRSRYQDHSLRYTYPLEAWTVERSSDPGTGMVTLRTTDGFDVCFSMPRVLQRKLADALASDGSYGTQIAMN